MNVSLLLIELKKIGAEIAEIEGREVSYWTAAFPVPDGADYGFIAYIYADGNSDISANLRESSSGEWFWFAAFEVVGYSSIHEAHTHFLETLVLLLDNPTRIVQKKGWLNMYFTCEYMTAGEWHYAGGGATLRFTNFRFPKIDGKLREYRSTSVRDCMTD